MGAPRETYVDPGIAADSGSGTIGDPYGDLQFALDSMTRDGTNGDRINIKAGTDEVLAATLSLTTYGTPSLVAPLIFQGYTAAAGDGGIAGIDGNGGAIWTTPGEFIYFVDCHLHNGGSSDLVTVSQRSGIIGCEINNTSGSGVVTTSSSGGTIVAGNHFHDIGTSGILGFPRAFNNYLKNGTKSFTRAIDLDEQAVAVGNIISIGGSSVGIYVQNGTHVVSANAILSAGGTGKGIFAEGGQPYGSSFFNNLVEGFSGSGGVGIYIAGTRNAALVVGNAAYNNTTDYTLDKIAANLGDNESLAASPFAKSGSDTFANRGVYFAPVDTGNVFGGS